ncbi:galactose-3-O-sulfotransferase 4-like [Mixophyes fleayi]|uniref:galactose-3-O-sulfotransferase 4-like n=1 Tax=Mixophyes fleayi TaxID=3061075 RepID=UPI003F4E1588
MQKAFTHLEKDRYFSSPMPDLSQAAAKAFVSSPVNAYMSTRMRFRHVNRLQIQVFGLIVFTIGFTVLLSAHFSKRSDGTLTLLKPIAASSSQTCQAKRHIVFLKTHKTAGSTVLNLLHRYGDRNGLNFALPTTPHFNYPNLFHSRRVKWFYSLRRPKYDILCHHMRFNLPEVQKVIPSDSFYFTIIRDPAKMAESAFSYYRFDSSAFRRARNFKAFISNPLRYYRQGDKSNIYARNLLSFDLGYNPDAPFTVALAKAQIKAVERTFNLVLLAEYFDESMIFLKDKLCWELDDVVTFKLNIRGTSMPLEKNEVDQLRVWNSLDWYLYSHFNRTFWEKVEHFGRVKMDNEVRRLRERRQQLAEICLESLEPVGAEDINDKAIKPYQSGQAQILGWAIKTNLSLDIHTQCVKMVTPELQYMDLLYRRNF